MRALELVQASLALQERLRFRYKAVLNGAFIVCFWATLPLWWFGMAWAAHSLGLEDQTPVQGHPSEVVFFMSAFAMLFLALLVAWIASSALVALCLRYVAKWGWREIRGLLVESRAPKNWLKPAKH
jgi:biotin transporter BioY